MISGIIFDKDGTLFDFNATWGAWSRTLLASEAGDDPVLLADLADVLGYDLATNQFRQGSLVIAETVDVVADAILTVLTDVDKPALIARMNAAGQEVIQVPATPLIPLFKTLKSLGLKVGVATNDAEEPAKRHLQEAGIDGLIDFVAGYDSGFGGKPAAGQLHGFCKATGLDVVNCVMIGDSLHDLHAGRAAGMKTVGVLTGPAPAAELAPFADVVLASIAELPHWIEKQG